jgi:hypothetical protein
MRTRHFGSISKENFIFGIASHGTNFVELALSKVQSTQWRFEMRKLIVAACCAALMGSISVASAQTTGPQGQQTLKANDSMNSNAKMMKKHKVKKHKTMKSGTDKDATKKM